MARTKSDMKKVAWSGHIVAVQPHIRLMRSFDQHYHSYHGYVPRIDGICGDQAGEFLTAVSKGADGKHRFCAGMELSGFSVPVEAPRLERAEFYKTRCIKVDREVKDGLSQIKEFPNLSWMASTKDFANPRASLESSNLKTDSG